MLSSSKDVLDNWISTIVMRETARKGGGDFRRQERKSWKLRRSRKEGEEGEQIEIEI